FTLSRSLAVPGEGQSASLPLETGPLRVLLFTALPDDVDAHRSRLDVEEEQARVLEALLPRIAEGRVELEMPDDGRFSTFKDLLREFRPHVLFLSGHGRFYHQPHTGEEPYGIFLFEDETDQGHAVRGEQLAEALIGSSVESLVLSACESGKAASTSLTAGLARRLAQQGIPQVIGMRESLLDRAGILLAHAFCDAVARGERVDLALQQARQAIHQDPGGSEGNGVLRDNSELSGVVELSRGQWSLPMLLSRDPSRPLIDWNFPLKPPQAPVSRGLGDLTLPPLFIGRRSELRRINKRLFRDNAGQLLLTGPGGQGKTALAGKLAQDLERRGFTSLVFQAGLDQEETAQRLEKFILKAQQVLSFESIQKYEFLSSRLKKEQDRLEMLLEELLRATGNKLVLVFDNLESIQDEETLEISNETVRNWLAAARRLAGKGLVLLLTSRHCLPDWSAVDHQPLGKTNYGGFLAIARQLRLPFSFYGDRNRLRRAYDVLHGNGRGLEFFAAAIKEMNAQEEEELFLALERAREEIQVNMCLEEIITRLSPEEKCLLERLPVYPVPVPLEGLVKLGLDLPDPEGYLKRLLDLSLLEQRWNSRLQTEEYQCPALVCELLAQQVGPPATPLRSLAADYLLYLFEQGQYRSMQ
ncbi:MAG: CHAT domain-containing protein, partial [Candidatus Electrothrix sp. AUS4]|nr:CHAT domain-containing protein [Candidatus Electrothrix sp. AUS4]